MKWIDHDATGRSGRGGVRWLRVGRHLLVTVATIGLLAGCDDDDLTGPNGGTPGAREASLSVGLAGGSGGAQPSLMAQGLELSDGTHTLVIESAEVVLRDIEFKRVETDDCEAAEARGEDDACVTFETGPFLVALPLDGSISRQLTAQVDTGRYEEIEFEVHKVSDDTPEDRAFLDVNPNFQDISLRVTGTFDGQSYTFSSDLNEDQEIELAMPLVITEETGSVNVTLTVDAAVWFATAGGALIDPRTALKGEPNENLVRDNIRASIEGFRDDDLDGEPHDDDPDES